MVLQTCLILAAALWLALLSPRHVWAAPAAVIAAALAGTTLPDFDATLHLGHRSGLTHSILPVAMAASWRRWWPAAAGLALGIAVHLSADLFPHAMRGFALIKLPGVHGIGVWPSYAWLAANAIAALALGACLAARAVPSHLVAAMLASVAVAAVSYLVRTDGGWWALALLAAPALLLLRPYGRSSS